ncbi:Ufm1-specific protease [Thraustotheca clavata]|uniref:Ufm1-specific protease n=1 Tax=Thraustotheca clavata TaxID=74557 RepID=A0A1W0ABD6_9STRA|nr:Ufm1-specific protease [Thraustotheca clavata]
MLPIGLGILGVVLILPFQKIQNDIETLVDEEFKQRPVGNENWYVFVYEQSSGNFNMHTYGYRSNAIKVSQVETWCNCARNFISKIEYVVLRCSASFPCFWKSTSPNAISKAIEDLQMSLTRPMFTFYELPNHDIVSHVGEFVKGPSIASSNPSIYEFCDLKKPGDSTNLTLRYGEVYDLNLLYSLSSDNAYVTFLEQMESTEVVLDLILCLPRTSSMTSVVNKLHERLIEQLDVAKDLAKDTQKLTSLSLNEFPLFGGAQHPIALWSINGSDINKQKRELLHNLLIQPWQPIFTNPCALSDLTHDVLINVHSGIKSSVPGGSMRLVVGDYGYYHYMQQNLNDKITANDCFMLPVPTTHMEIQQMLVKIGDKPSSFIGSKEWIGSMEIGYVLEELYSTTFRTIHCPSGAQLSQYASQLYDHFTLHGTPVMLGGANLAYIILGVDYNADTKDISFLILDPHYTGDDNLTAILTKPQQLENFKGYACGWRKPKSFSKSSFYNFCLPQRPNTI